MKEGWSMRKQVLDCLRLAKKLGERQLKWIDIEAYIQSLNNIMMILKKAFIFILKYIFWRSKEAAGNLVNVATLLWVTITQFFNHWRGKPAVLAPPHSNFDFPLPNRWTNTKSSLSRQNPHLTVMQLEYTGTAAGTAQYQVIEQAVDKSLANLTVMNTLTFTKRRDIHTIEDVIKRYERKSLGYTLQREILIGESIVNGENPFLLRKFNGRNLSYDLTGMDIIENNYRKAVLNKFANEQMDLQNLAAVGLTQKTILEKLNEINKGDAAYSMFFEHLENLTDGKPMQHTPTIFMDNVTIQETYYLQSPYPVFLKVTNGLFEGYICIAVAFRYKSQTGEESISVFSPFFVNQPYKLWKLAQCQLLQGYFNDFHVRVHLGVLHFTTNQYNVPIYNSLRASNLTVSPYNHRLEKFIDHAYTLFNHGLEGVNVAATATLVSEVEDYSIVNKVFNFSYKQSLSLIANYSNRLNMSAISPAALLAKNGLTRQDVDQKFDLLSLDFQLYDILASYIKEVYDLYAIDSFTAGIQTAVDLETPNMRIMNQQARPTLGEPDKVLNLVQSLAFCWVGYHAHTFTTMPFAEYWEFRPSMLRKIVPNKEEDWSKIIDGDEIPHPKVLMSTSQIIGGVSQKDPENFLIDMFRRKALNAAYLKLNAQTVEEQAESEKLEVTLRNAIKKLEDYGRRITEMNQNRYKMGQTQITWMHPAVLQASLNI